MARPTIRNRFYILLRDFSFLGAMGTFRLYATRARRRFHGREEGSRDPTADFDLRFHVDTVPSAVPDDLCIPSQNSKNGCAYVPTREDLFKRMLEHAPSSLRDYVFVDMGSGKGMVILMASEYPFKKIIGVEYSAVLCAIAQKNISAYFSKTQQCRDITSICADATEFKLPDEPLIIYFFNPFQGKVMDRVIRLIEQSLERCPRDTWIIYSTPWEHRKFKRSAYFRTVESNCSFCVYRSVSLHPQPQ